MILNSYLILYIYLSIYFNFKIDLIWVSVGDQSGATKKNWCLKLNLKMRPLLYLIKLILANFLNLFFYLFAMQSS